MKRLLLLLMVLFSTRASFGQSVFYLPRVLAIPGTQTGIALSNPTVDPASVSMTYYRSDGSVIDTPQPITIPAAGQIARLSTELFSNAQDQRGWVRLSSNVADITGFYLNGDFVRTTDGGDFAPVANTLTFPWIIQNGTTSTELTLTNTSASSITTQWMLYNGGGSLVASRTLDLDPNAQKIGTIESLMQVSGFPLGYLRIQSSGPVVGAEVVQDKNRDTALLNARIDAPSTNLVFPHVATGGGYTTWISIHNTGTVPVEVTLDFFRENGTAGAAAQLRTVNPGELFQQSVQTLFGLDSADLLTGWVRGTSTGGALEGFQVFVADGPGGMTALPARKSASVRLMQSHIAEEDGPVLHPTDLYTGLAILNPSDVAAADVTVSIVGIDGVQISDYAVTLQPHQKQALLLREMMIEALGETSGTVWIQSTVGIHALQVYGTWDLSLLSQIPAQSTALVSGLAVPRTDRYTISGTITAAAAGTSVAGLAVDATGAAAAHAETDYLGRFVLKGLPSGSYSVTPSGTGLAFSPATVSLSLTSRFRGQQFTASPDSGTGGSGGGTPGLSVTPEVVDVVVSSPGSAVGAYQVSFAFDPSIVELAAADVTGGDTPFSTPPLTININNTEGTVTLNDFKLSGAPPGTTVVARLRFTPKAAGASTLTITESVVTNVSGDTISAATITFSSSQILVQ
jgi:hypothetical protein